MVDFERLHSILRGVQYLEPWHLYGCLLDLHCNLMALFDRMAGLSNDRYELHIGNGLGHGLWGCRVDVDAMGWLRSARMIGTH